MAEKLRRAGKPRPSVIGIDEILVRKGHTYRIVVNDLEKRQAFWFGGNDRSEESMELFYEELGPSRCEKILFAVMDMWPAFENATLNHTVAAILYDHFHVQSQLGKALDTIRKSEYARVSGKDRRFIKGQWYHLLSNHENLTLDGKRALKTSLKWRKRKPCEAFAAMVERHWEGIVAYFKPENKVSLGFVEGLNNKIRVIQRRAYGLRDEEYLRLKILTCQLPDFD